MDTRTIKKLIELVKETGIGELEVKSGEDSVRISCFPNSSMTKQTATSFYIPTQETRHENEIERKTTSHTEETKSSSEKNKKQQGHIVKAPMVGTVYLAPNPGAEPFVSVGQRVNIGDTLCMIEAMKMFNKIEADKSGIISARLIENEQPIEYDQSLFILDVGE